MRSGSFDIQSWWPAVATTVVAVAGCALVAWLLGDSLARSGVLLAFLPAVVLGAYVGGMWCGLLATALSLVVAGVALQHDALQERTFGSPGQLQSLLFGVAGVAVSGLGSRSLMAARRRTTVDPKTALYCEIFRNSNDGIGIVDASGHYLEQNAAHHELTGYTADDLAGKTPAIHLGQETFGTIAAELARSGHWRGEVVSRGRADRDTPIEMSAFTVRDDSGKPLCFVGIKRDISERKRQESRLTAEHAVTRILSEAQTLDEAAPQILDAVRRSLQFPAGLLWCPDETGSSLRVAYSNTADGDTHRRQFIDQSRAMIFKRGDGLPGRAWESGEPAWIVDLARDASFRRAVPAADAGLRSGMAFPIIAGGQFFGVFEFYADRLAEPDPQLLQMMSAVGSEIGQFILRRRAEQQLRRSQHELSDFFESASIGLHAVGPDGIILWANPAELEMLGYPREQYVGRHIADFHADREVIDRILACLSEGKTLESFPARMRCRDGSIKQVLIDSSVMFEDGEFVHTRCFTRDVTAQKQIEEALRNSEQSLRLALEAGRMGTWEWDIARGAVQWSAGLEAMHGLAPGTFAGTFDAFLADVHPDDRERVANEIRQTLEHRRDHHIEYRLRLPDGTVRWVEGRGKIFFDDSGAPVRMVGVCTDVTERKTAEQQRLELLERERAARADAERANRTKDEFLAFLSHELRTPLTPVLLTVTLLENARHLPADLLADLQTIRRNVELEARLIDDLLDLTRIARGKLQLDLQTVDMHLIVRSAIEICHRDDRARLVVDLRAQRHQVRGDPARLQQVFWNLLNNAHKFTPQDGTITVRSRDLPDGQILIDVIDTGVGIEPEAISRIFDAFEQGHSESRRFGGLGLGLAISRALMEAHGGSLSAHSDGPGQGAAFSVQIPSILSSLPAPTEPPSGNGHAPTRPLRILVVEDHDATRLVLSRLLSAMGHDPVTAGGIESALECVMEHPVDLVISDLGLPDGNGHELMRRIRQRCRVRGIALSGYGMEDDVRRSREAGFTLHLTKPVDLGRLEAAIREVVEHAEHQAGEADPPADPDPSPGAPVPETTV